MAECCGDIVYRSDERGVTVSQALADDDAALVKAYEKALKSFQGTKTADKPKQTEDGKKEDFLESEDHGKEPDDCKMMTQHQWAVGSRCLAKWSETGLLYPAVLLWIKGQHCRVKFEGYGNEEEIDLSELLPENLEQPSGDQQWTLGSRCRAVWSDDGLVYPAVLVWAEGQRGRVLFDVYGNEEELELSALLPPEEQEPSVSTVTEALQRDLDGGSSSGWRKLEKQKISANKEDSTSSSLSSGTNDTGGGQNRECCNKQKKQKSTKKAGNWRGSKMGSQASFCAPPVLPPPEASAGYLPFPPPSSVLPPRRNGDESSSGPDSDVAELSSMLLSWYLCGYHTGYYMALQQTNSSHEKTKKKYKTNFKYRNGKP
ncbi:survival motor neuron protein-like [Scleropages formosus]|uniref:survival motor neuron protein-like n=1 Tax=Scleropages formosus TaxID=113540 RepID=UPI0010FA6970|nr:survival motor neuron protein-like [Scleropages formosus]XP_018601385.2 survival motor neuron protein-like [Scleropages formosus]